MILRSLQVTDMSPSGVHKALKKNIKAGERLSDCLKAKYRKGSSNSSRQSGEQSDGYASGSTKRRRKSKHKSSNASSRAKRRRIRAVPDAGPSLMS